VTVDKFWVWAADVVGILVTVVIWSVIVAFWSCDVAVDAVDILVTVAVDIVDILVTMVIWSMIVTFCSGNVTVDEAVDILVVWPMVAFSICGWLVVDLEVTVTFGIGVVRISASVVEMNCQDVESDFVVVVFALVGSISQSGRVHRPPAVGLIVSSPAALFDVANESFNCPTMRHEKNRKQIILNFSGMCGRFKFCLVTQTLSSR